MAIDLRALLGLGGVAPSDNHRAQQWEKRLHWVMIVVAVLSVPSFYLEEIAREAPLRVAGQALDLFILGAFSAEFLWMLSVVDHRRAYIRRNWLNLLIIAFTAASALGMAAEWVALGRLARVAIVALLVARAAGSVRGLFEPGRVHYLIVISAGSLVISGAAFYWLEPTIHTFWDGMWLAFVTGATVGYGDVVPTTVGSRIFAVLSVLVGFTMLSLMTAAIVARFVGQDESRLRQEMHADIRRLRADIAELVSDEERSVRREVRDDMRKLAGEIERLREEIARLAAEHKDARRG
jgi:voltage-gated potassium channel